MVYSLDETRVFNLNVVTAGKEKYLDSIEVISTYPSESWLRLSYVRFRLVQCVNLTAVRFFFFCKSRLERRDKSGQK